MKSAVFKNLPLVMSKSDYNFNMKTQNFSLLSNPNINSVFSGDLSIKGDSKSGVIYGSIDSKRIDIYLPREFPSDIPKLNVYKVILKQSKGLSLQAL